MRGLPFVVSGALEIGCGAEVAVPTPTVENTEGLTDVTWATTAGDAGTRSGMDELLPPLATAATSAMATTTTTAPMMSGVRLPGCFRAFVVAGLRARAFAGRGGAGFAVFVVFACL